MQRHIKVYREFFGIGDQDIYNCEICDSNQSCEIHHIHSRGYVGFDYEGGYYDINDILNLILVCRFHHGQAHGGELSKNQLFKYHLDFILKFDPYYQLQE